MSQSGETLILGGGLSGLALARMLDGPRRVLEASATPGGLCRSFVKDGFTYDIGGHILFSRENELLSLMTGWLGDNLLSQKRANRIWFKDRFVKYPFENDLASLDAEDNYECLMGFLQREDGQPANLEEWARFRFGPGISGKYLIPYNDKIWKRPARDISVHWVERIPSPPLEDVVKSAVGISTEGYVHQLNFQYPRQGGIQALTDGLAADAPLTTGFRVSGIKRLAGGWEVTDGRQTAAGERLISTLPMWQVPTMLPGAPAEVLAAAQALQYNALIVVMLAVKGEALADASAIYIPDPEILPHRVCYMSYFSPHNAPAGSSHLAAEITVPPGGALLDASDDELIARTLEGVGPICGIASDEVVAAEVRRIPHAYVVYDRDYLKNRGLVAGWLEEQGMRLLGRWGSFEYLNMDQCVERARDLAGQLNQAGS